MIWDIFSAVDPVELEEGAKKLREAHGIQEPTKEEREYIDNFLKE